MTAADGIDFFASEEKLTSLNPVGMVKNESHVAFTQKRDRVIELCRIVTSCDSSCYEAR